VIFALAVGGGSLRASRLLPHPLLCYKPDMRKWMRDRLQRRKKKTPDKTTEAPPPPLQPAYFETEQPADNPAEGRSPAQEEVPRADEPERNVPPPEAAAAPQPAELDLRSNPPSRQPSAESGAQIGRTRRRRGGRGRGGRGREQAVAQAFAPAAVKGSIPGTAAVEMEPSKVGELDAGSPAAVGSMPAAPVAASPRPPKGLVVLAIGLPGSGKSSWFKRHNVVPLSSDMVRSLLFDDVREQRFQDLVFSNLRSMLKARLIAKRPTNYVDATNLTPQERQHWIKLAKDYGYEVHAVFFDVPLEVCIDRHQRRDRVVPEDVMRRMAAKLKPPAFEEGFAKITVVRVKKKEDAG
jgi:predicted kinase